MSLVRNYIEGTENGLLRSGAGLASSTGGGVGKQPKSLAKHASGMFPGPKPPAKAQTDQQKRQGKEYYVRNRERLLREGRQWKLEHKSQTKRYARRYQRQVKAGARVPQMRGKVGLGYQFLGARPQKSTAVESPNRMSMTRERRA